MSFVTDTHSLLYFVSGKHGRLSRRVANLFRKAESGDEVVFIPVVVFMELEILVRKGQVAITGRNFSSWVGELLDCPGFVAQDVTLEIVLACGGLSPVRDPIDSLIVATSRYLDIPLITKDQRIVDSRLVEVFW